VTRPAGDPLHIPHRLSGIEGDMSAPSPFRRTDPAHTPGFIRKYHLVIHRSPGVLLHEVVRAVRRVTRFAEAEAMARMWDAHHRGRAVVTTTYLERAEYLADLLAEGGIRVSLEAAVHR
jgi:ATP-dependent Clp protease adaptor protein ClpS